MPQLQSQPQIDCDLGLTGRGPCLRCGFAGELNDLLPIHHPCGLQPDLRPAAARLGVPFESIGPISQIVSQWMAQGYPTRTADEQAACFAICEVCPDHAAIEDRCQCKSCSKKGQHLPPLRKMRNWNCPAGKWPTAAQSGGW